MLYGSDTGTAEDVAFHIFRQVASFFDSVAYHAMNEYEIALLPTEEYVIFVTSTTGDGEVPGNMQSFWRFLLQRSLHPQSLNKLNFAVFGLGDSSYEKFNAAARRLSMRLKQLGGSEMLTIGLGDDQARCGLLTALEPWKSDLWNVISTKTSRRPPVKYNLIEKCFSIEVKDNHVHTEEYINYVAPETGSAVTNQVEVGLVKDNIRMTAIDWEQDVRLVKIQLQQDGTGASYRAGDVAFIYPHNSLHDATRMLHILSRCAEVKMDTFVHIQNSSLHKRTKQLGDTRCTILHLLMKCLDINGIPQRSFFEICASYTENEEEKDKLLEIASGEGYDIYLDYCVLAKRTFLEILEDFTSVKLDLDVMLEVIPRLMPRLYSIASSGLVSPDTMNLCVGLVNYTSRYGRQKRGTFLLNLNRSFTIYIDL